MKRITHLQDTTRNTTKTYHIMFTNGKSITLSGYNVFQVISSCKRYGLHVLHIVPAGGS